MSTWGAKFVCHLMNMGYGNAHELSANDFDWLHEQQDLIPFLNWFCNEVDPGQALTEKEIDDFEELKREGKTILEGEILDAELADFYTREDFRESNDDELQEEMKSLEEELKFAEKRQKIKVNLQNKFSIKYSALAQRSADLSLVCDQMDEMSEEKFRECEVTGKELENVYSGLESLVISLKGFYDGFNCLENSETNHCVSVHDLTEFYAKEELHNSLLDNFIRKQFQGIEKIFENDEKHHFFLQVNQPDLNLVQERSQKEYSSLCMALKTLVDEYPQITLDQIDAEMKHCELEARLAKIKEILQKINESNFPTDKETICLLQTQTENEAVNLEKRIEKLRNETIKEKVKECANSLSVQIILGDYSVKMIRQKYLESKLEMVLQYLYKQRARWDLLVLLHQMELDHHKLIDNYLDEIKSSVEEDEKSLSRTITILTNLPSAQANFLNDSEESASIVFRNLLDSKRKSFTLHKYALLEAAKTFQNKLNRLESAHTQFNLQREEERLNLEKTREKLEEAVFDELHPGSKLFTQTRTRKLIPITELPKVELVNAQVEQQMAELEKNMFVIINERDAKQKLLRNNEFLQRERKIFHLFYTDPEELKSQNEELEKFFDKEEKN